MRLSSPAPFTDGYPRLGQDQLSLVTRFLAPRRPAGRLPLVVLAGANKVAKPLRKPREFDMAAVLTQSNEDPKPSSLAGAPRARVKEIGEQCRLGVNRVSAAHDVAASAMPRPPTAV
jgi:hypothetical protein